MNIDSNVFLAIGLAAIFQSILLYLIIGIATKAEKRAKYEWAQMDLLGKIALRQGVPADEIAKTYSDAGLK